MNIHLSTIKLALQINYTGKRKCIKLQMNVLKCTQYETCKLLGAQTYKLDLTRTELKS